MGTPQATVLEDLHRAARIPRARAFSAFSEGACMAEIRRLCSQTPDGMRMSALPDELSRRFPGCDPRVLAYWLRQAETRGIVERRLGAGPRDVRLVCTRHSIGDFEVAEVCAALEAPGVPETDDLDALARHVAGYFGLGPVTAALRLWVRCARDRMDRRRPA